MRPVSVTVLLLGLLYTFKIFDIALVMTGGDLVDATWVLSLYVHEVFFTFFRFGEGAAAGLLLLVVPLLAGVFYVRRLQRKQLARRFHVKPPRRPWLLTAVAALLTAVFLLPVYWMAKIGAGVSPKRDQARNGLDRAAASRYQAVAPVCRYG